MSNKRTPPISSALNGALERHADGWQWRTGEIEPRVRDMLRRDVAPNFRCLTMGSGRTYVEIPQGWHQRRYWPGGQVDTQVASEIEALIRDAGEQTAIYAEGLAEALDDHRLTTTGYRVDVAQWDAVMTEQCGCLWDREHEAEILAKAESLRSA